MERQFKYLIINVFFLFSFLTDDRIDKDNCTFKNISLYGKVRVVENFGDIKVKIVNSFPDLNVKIVENFPNECGEWQMVEHFEDFTIEFVDNLEDIKIKYVTNFQGLK